MVYWLRPNQAKPSQGMNKGRGVLFDWGQIKLSQAMQTVQVCTDWGQVKLSQIMQAVEERIDWSQVKLSQVVQTEKRYTDWGQVKLSQIKSLKSGEVYWLSQTKSCKQWRSVLIQAKSL